MRNLGLKLFSILIAVGLFFFVNSENNTSVVGFLVPVELKNLPVGKMLVWPLAPQARVSVRGPSYLVSRVATANLTFKVTVPKDAPHSFVAQLKETDLGLPPPVTVVSLEPNEIEFILDNQVEQSVPISIAKIGSIASGLKIDSIKIVPANARLTGPESEIRKFSQVETEPIDLSQIKESDERRVSLRIPGTMIRINPEHVEMRVKISPVEEKRIFQSVPVEIRTRGDFSFAVRPLSVNIEIVGSKELVDAVDPKTVLPYVRPVEKIALGTKLEVKVDLPAGVKLSAVTPPSVEVTVSSQESVHKQKSKSR